MCVRFFFFQAEDGIRATSVTGVQTCALPICGGNAQRTRKNNKLINGTKKRVASQTGWSASRSRFTVMATPTEINGIETSNNVARNLTSIFERWSNRAAFPSGAQ